MAAVPDMQFLDKNSKFRVKGRTMKSFKLLARAVQREGVTGREKVIAQVESENFKVRAPGVKFGVKFMLCLE